MIMKRTLSVTLLGTALLLGACQPQYQWVNSSRPAADMTRDSTACEQSVARLYPYQPVVVQTSHAYVTSGYRSCYHTYYGRTCDYVPGTYVPPTYATQDMNASQRQASFNACLNSKGWHLARAQQ